MFDFPSSPAEGASYSPAGGPRYVFTGGVWRSTGMVATGTAEARNRLINPGMTISQENAAAPGTTTGYYLVDQWAMFKTHSAGTMTAKRYSLPNFTPNGGFVAAQVTVTAADASLAASEYLNIGQPLEGIRCVDFMWGYPEARQVVARFGFKGPAGTYAMAMTNSNESRAYVASFTISAGQANTLTQQVFIIPGDTTGGATWPGGNGQLWGYFYVTLAAGTTYAGTNATWQAGPKYGVTGMTNGMATGGAVFEISDVGLYLDPNATGTPPPWQMPDEAQELQACKRYWYNINGFLVNPATSSYTYPLAPMRIAPAITGGAAGFIIGSYTATSFSCYQTTQGYQNLTMNARM